MTTQTHVRIAKFLTFVFVVATFAANAARPAVRRLRAPLQTGRALFFATTPSGRTKLTGICYHLAI